MNEPIERLLRLCTTWPRVCIGSTSIYSVVGSAAWHNRMADVFNQIDRKFSRIPWLHMLRGMSLAGSHYPFASLDSTDIARNHHIPHNGAVKMADRWDTAQCAGTWGPRATQMEMT